MGAPDSRASPRSTWNRGRRLPSSSTTPNGPAASASAISFDARPRRLGGVAERPRRAEQSVLARIGRRHGEPDGLRIGGGRRSCRIDAHADARRADAVGAAAGMRPRRRKNVGQRLDRLHHRPVVRRMHDCAGGVSDEIGFGRRRIAVEFREAGEDAAADRGVGKCAPRRGNEIGRCCGIRGSAVRGTHLQVIGAARNHGVDGKAGCGDGFRQVAELSVGIARREDDFQCQLCAKRGANGLEPGQRVAGDRLAGVEPGHQALRTERRAETL